MIPSTRDIEAMPGAEAPAKSELRTTLLLLVLNALIYAHVWQLLNVFET